MGEFKGTPGPWLKDVRTSRRGSPRIVAIIPKKYGERVLETELVTGYISDDDCGVETCCMVEEHSNARLIASAPDLLSACQSVVNGYEGDGMEQMGVRDETFYKVCKDAINKALGSEVKPC
jgi:hypothetical protein